MEIRIGVGFDIHRLAEGRDLIIGGTKIDSDFGFIAHSDGDIFFHALTDALLGAVGFGDIGQLFPDTDKRWKNAPSNIFLEKARDIVYQRGYKISNIDAVIVLEKVKILPYREQIIDNTAKILNISKEKIFLKGKRFEGIDDIGKGEGGFCIVNTILMR
ncbi:MAG: 2-C-methyl-D-erythritol 2,4-cyclodiphosphate synthase [Aquificae bacterium]|nr:2-C-methyl-D-erythritol 2,4-cyclodiphosphate synthase [Aquificota bacterium]